jgi:polysaccharide export outer membrane protein
MTHPTRLLLICAIVITCLVSAAAFAQESEPMAGEREPIDPDQQMQPLDESTPAAPVDPNTYVIGAEDHLSIRVWREREVSGGVVVRPDGMISMPLIGEVHAGGKTPEQLGKVITERLSEYLTRPEVLVSVTAIRSKKYYITGQVNRTGAFPLVVPTTILEALSGAGGFGQWANTKKIVILRGEKRIPFNYKEVIKGKNLEQNIYLQNGDHILVP